MDRQRTGGAIAWAALIAAGCALASAQGASLQGQPWTPPKTPWGAPDLQGTWNYATMTPLERPRDLADKAVLSADEAAAYERRTNERQRAANNTAGPDWWDPGDTASGRPSYIARRRSARRVGCRR